MKKILVSILLASFVLVANAQVFQSNGNQDVVGKLSVYPSGTTSDNSYNGTIVITKPAMSGQYLNLIRQGSTRWSLGTVYNTNTFAIGQGTTSDAGFIAPFFNITPSGNVGIGTTEPITNTKLDVRGNIYINSGMDDNHIYWGDHNMTMGTPPDNYAHNVFSLKPGGSTQGDLLTRFCMYHAYKKDSIVEKVRLASAESSFLMGGYVGIGIKTPQYLLDVAGIIRAKEIIVTVNGFPDFVFQKNYTLPKLQDIDIFIQSNGHLPNIPSAKEVEKNGLSMADLQIKLLQKVEELTLYAIEQQKIVSEQQLRIKQLENAMKVNK